jgi:quercetin dioxygenase-like cupin family protein
MARQLSRGLIVVVVLSSLGIALLLAARALRSTEPAGHVVDEASATPSWDLVIHRVRFEPGSTNGWHSHPGGVFVAVLSGAFTLHTGDDDSCTARTYVAGQGFFEHANAVHLGRNEGPQPFEGYVMYVGIPPGAPLFKTESYPGGADCPSLTASTTGIARTELGRATLSEPLPIGVED